MLSNFVTFFKYRHHRRIELQNIYVNIKVITRLLFTHLSGRTIVMVLGIRNMYALCCSRSLSVQYQLNISYWASLDIWWQKRCFFSRHELCVCCLLCFVFRVSFLLAHLTIKIKTLGQCCSAHICVKSTKSNSDHELGDFRFIDTIVVSYRRNWL